MRRTNLTAMCLMLCGPLQLVGCGSGTEGQDPAQASAEVGTEVTEAKTVGPKWTFEEFQRSLEEGGENWESNDPAQGEPALLIRPASDEIPIVPGTPQGQAALINFDWIRVPGKQLPGVVKNGQMELGVTYSARQGSATRSQMTSSSVSFDASDPSKQFTYVWTPPSAVQQVTFSGEGEVTVYVPLTSVFDLECASNLITLKVRFH